MISKGNNVKFACFILLATCEETKMWLLCFIQRIIKKVLDSVFVIHRIIKVSVRIIMKTHTSTFWITQKPHPIIVYNPPQYFRHLWCSSDDCKTFLLEFYSTLSLLQIVVLSAVNNSNKEEIIFFLAFRSCGNHRDGWLCYSTRSHAPWYIFVGRPWNWSVFVFC